MRSCPVLLAHHTSLLFAVISFVTIVSFWYMNPNCLYGIRIVIVTSLVSPTKLQQRSLYTKRLNFNSNYLIFHQHHIHSTCMRMSTTATTATTTTLGAAQEDMEVKIAKTTIEENKDADTTTNTNSTSSDDNDDPMYGLPKPLILGSASFTRKLILKDVLEIPYHIFVRSISEQSIGNRTQYASSENLVRTIAMAKMNHLLQEIQNGNCHNELPSNTTITSLSTSSSATTTTTNTNEYIIMTADQVVTCQGRILEKPSSIDEAKEFVSIYGMDHPCTTVGCIVLTHIPSYTTISSIHSASIYFSNTLTADKASELVDTLVEQNEPILSCAGALMFEHPLVQEYIDHIVSNSDPIHDDYNTTMYSIMGLCPNTVKRLLRGLHTSLPIKFKSKL